VILFKYRRREPHKSGANQLDTGPSALVTERQKPERKRGQPRQTNQPQMHTDLHG